MIRLLHAAGPMAALALAAVSGGERPGSVMGARPVTVHASGHECRVPGAAYSTLDGSGVVGSVPAEFPEKDRRAMERFSYCLCGPEGSVDWDPRSHKHGGFFMHPSCNRDGWNGHRYGR